MVFIRDSDIQRKLASSYKAYQSEQSSYEEDDEKRRKDEERRRRAAKNSTKDKDEGNFFTFLGDVGKNIVNASRPVSEGGVNILADAGNALSEGTTQGVKTAGTGLGHAIDDFSGTTERREKAFEKLQNERQAMMLKQLKRSQDKSLSKEKRDLARRSARSISNSMDEDYKRHQEGLAQKIEETDPIKQAGATVELASTVATLGGGTLAKEGAKMAVRGGLSLAKNEARKNIARTAAYEAGVGGAIGAASTAREKGSEATAQDYLVNSGIGAGLGGALGGLGGALANNLSGRAARRALAGEEEKISRVGDDVDDLAEEEILAREANRIADERGLPQGQVRTLDDVRAEREALQRGEFGDDLYDEPALPSIDDLGTARETIQDPAFLKAVDELEARRTPLREELDNLPDDETFASRQGELVQQHDAELKNLDQRIQAMRDSGVDERAIESFTRREASQLENKYARLNDSMTEELELAGQRRQELQPDLDEISESERVLLENANQRHAEFAPTPQRQLSAEKVRERFRALRDEETALRQNTEGYKPTVRDYDDEITDIQNGVIESKNPQADVEKLMDNKVKAQQVEAATSKQPRVPSKEDDVAVMQDAIEGLPEIPKESYNIFSRNFELPTEFMRTLGLTKTAQKVDNAKVSYRNANYDDLQKIASWKNNVKDKTETLFDAANGDKTAFDSLSNAGKKAVREWQGFAKQAAKELGIPEEGRFVDYIPHLFSREGRPGVKKMIELEKRISDLQSKNTLTAGEKASLTKAVRERANLIDTDSDALRPFFKKSGNIQNNFLKERTGAEGYNRDFWAAVQLYTQQKNRKIHIEPATKAIMEVANGTASMTNKKYLTGVADQLAGRKDPIDLAMGDKVVGAARVLKNAQSRAKLGLSASSVINSTMQAINIAPVIGARAAGEGMLEASQLLAQIAKNKMTGQETKLWKEMLRNGVFEGSSQILPEESFKKVGLNFDKAIFSGIQGADRFMRASTYLGAKKVAARKGLTGKDAEVYAVRMSNKVNQNFDKMEVPPAFRSQASRTLGGLVTFAPGQLMRTGDVAMQGVKGAGRAVSGKSALEGTLKEDLDKVLKTVYLAAGAYYMGEGVKQITGSGEAIPNPLSQDFWNTPQIQFWLGNEFTPGVKSLLFDESRSGEDYASDAQKFFTQVLPSYLVPGWSQGKRIVEGAQVSEDGMSTTEAGNVRYLANPDNDLQRSIFGQYSTPEGREYIDNMYKEGGGALRESYSNKVKNAPEGEQQEFYDFFRSAEGITGKQSANGKIRELIDQGQPAKARRLAEEFNAKVDERMGAYYAMYPDISPELEEYLNDQLYIKTSTPRFRQ